MKRTPLKRSSPPRRTSKIGKVGKRAEREREALEVFRTLVLARARFRCERCGRRPSPGALFGEPEFLCAHHVLPRARGGKHELTNGACLCMGCHDDVHTHRAEDWRAWLVQTNLSRSG